MPDTPPSIIPINVLSLPGIKRDGTTLDGNNYVDGQWMRFQRGLPRKIGGYRRITNLLDGVGRGMNVFDQNNETYTHIGYSDTLQQMRIDPNGVVSAFADRTPAAFAVSVNNLWQFDQIYDTGNTTNTLVAHAAPNAADISSDVETPVYYGDITDTAALATTGFPDVSGGVVVSNPYVWAFGSDGIAYWSPPNDPAGYSSTGSGAARISASKVVRGMPLRAGAGNGPVTLFWTINTLERATFTGGTAIFNFDTITSQSSILSANSVIEYNGVYFWIGLDSFLIYNGVVRELPNNMNINYFFDNLNYSARQRVFAYKVPRFGEIWWCYPRGSATECTHAIIYNVREDLWYDTELPMSGRSCGQYAQVFKSPLMCGVDADTTTGATTYKLWQHEFGVDAIDGTDVLAIPSYFETAEIGMPVSDNPQLGGTANNSIAVNLVEPDFVQTGDMELVVKARWNARSPEHVSDPYTFVDEATVSDEELIMIRETGRYMRFKFTSNTQGGNYETGKVLVHVQQTDGRLRS